MACEWEYTGDTAKELPNYLFELVLRTKVGSTLRGVFTLRPLATTQPITQTRATMQFGTRSVVF